MPQTTTALGGRFRVVVTRVGMHDAQDVTIVRGAKTLINNYSNADPFGDGTLSLSFPRITSFDDWSAPDLALWLADDSDVDIWWVPGYASNEGRVHPPGENLTPFMNPLTGTYDAISPDTDWTTDGLGHYTGKVSGVKVWEGFFVSFDPSDSAQAETLEVQCQGALFQDDAYFAKPYYPPNPQTLESLITGAFDKTQKPHLRTSPAHTVFPAGWTKVAPPASSYANPDIYAPNVAPGTPWTGYSQRDTGSWQRTLTGFIQSLLALMVTQKDSGVTPGNQWTMLQALQGDPQFPAGRTPVLQVRDRFRAPDIEYWNGQQGVTKNLTRDNSQTSDVVYGSGTNLDGTDWRNALISKDGQRTDYAPLAASPEIYPAVNNPLFRSSAIAREAYNQYGPGFNQTDATTSAQETLRRDLDPGWSGTITVSTDPSLDMSRWQIRAGMTIKLKGFNGTGATGMNFHIASTSHSPEAGTVELTVDSRYRDLLNVEEALARTRDPMTPSKLLLVGQSSYLIEDAMAPWDYAAGSGFVPVTSLSFYNYLKAGDGFPYVAQAKLYPPSKNPAFYVQCHADAITSRGRWVGPIAIRMAEKGTISRAEFFVVDGNGTPLPLPFHVSLYYVNVSVDDMPFSFSNYSPFQDDAFSKINPATGQPWGPGSFLPGADSIIRGYGVKGQLAGYSPGQSSDGFTKATGLLIDESSWTFDCTNNGVFDPNLSAGQTQPQGAVAIYAMFYANTGVDSLENPSAVSKRAVYFGGRLYRQAPSS